MADIELKVTNEEFFVLMDAVSECIFIHNVIDGVYPSCNYFKDITDKRLKELRHYLNSIVLVKDLHRVRYEDMINQEV